MQHISCFYAPARMSKIGSVSDAKNLSLRKRKSYMACSG